MPEPEQTLSGPSLLSASRVVNNSINGPESTSCETVSEELDDPSNPKLHQDDEAHLPLLRMLGFNSEFTFYSGSTNYDKFTIESVGGLLGTDKLAEFPCVHDCAAKKFYVQIGKTDYAFFTKSTLLNLCDFAEKENAQQIVFILDRQNGNASKYKSTLRMVDAEKLGKIDITELFEKTLDANSIKDLRTEQSFFLMEL